MKEELVFTEEPEDDLWRSLLQFTYKANIERYFVEHEIEFEDSLINCIAGSFLQAYEYYKASKTVNLQIAPLLLYYGTTNLLYGMSNIMAGKMNTIHNHGMRVLLSEPFKYIAETTINFDNYTAGGIHVFARALKYESDLTQGGSWIMKELLSSVAEINSDYLKCYSETLSNVFILDISKTPTGTIEKIKLDGFSADEFFESCNNIIDFDKAYLNPQVGGNFEGEPHIILRRKINSKNIAKTSYSGRPYLQIGQRKNGKLIELPTILNLYISLFALGSLCRYKPEIWSPFVMNDTTGEKLLIDKLLNYSRRMLPNLVLNVITDRMNIFTSEKYCASDKIKLVGEHEVKELIGKELYRQSQMKEVSRNEL